QGQRTTDGSGRFTVDIRRPGATVDEDEQAQRDALNDEVDHAFQSLMGQPATRDEETHDELTPTTPMRVFSAQKDDAKPIERTEERTRPAVQQDAPKTAPARATSSAPKERLSLSERLRKIREESADAKPSSALPSRSPAPKAKPAAKPASIPAAKPAA